MNINFQFPVNEVAAAVVELLLPHIKNFKPSEELQEEKNFTRKETAEKLNVSLPTLTAYAKRGLITGHRFGVRVMYKQSDIAAALTKMNYGRAGNV